MEAPVSDTPTFSLDLEQRERFQFDVTFDNPSWSTIQLDEPVPIGDGTAPNAARLVGAAIGNCLAASLLFCLQKSRVELAGISAHVDGVLGRNERGRLRIASVHVTLRPVLDGVPPERLGRCLDLFEDFCVVTESVRKGIEVEVTVETQETAGAAG
jgi:organic hydroperoxide reductase OsmC/OhrA